MGKSVPPLTEPELVGLAYVTGGAVEVDQDIVRFLCWSEFPHHGEIIDERRLMVRMVMPVSVALSLAEQLMTQLKRGSPH